MIVSLPPIHPDEDFRSIFYRYHIRTPHRSYIKSRKEFFLQKIEKPIFYPRNLSRIQMALVLPESFTTYMIQNHSFYPLFRPFMPLADHNVCKQGMLGETTTQTLLAKTTQSWHPLIKTIVHYCPTCVAEDINEYGECFIHRIHQFYRVNYCPMHGDLLLSHCQDCGVPFGDESRSMYLIEPYCQNGHAIVRTAANETDCEFISNYISDLYSLMDARDLTLDDLFIKIISHIGHREYIHYKGVHIFKKELLTAFIQHYGFEYFEKMEINAASLTAEKIMVVFLQKQHLRKNILIYLLLMRYFSGSVSNFLSISPPEYTITIPFGSGPWMCVNNICPYYCQRVVRSCIRKSHEYITGIFTCPHCGLIYSRKGHPKEENEEQFSIDTRGELFQSRAIRYYNEGFNIEEISQKLLSNKTSVCKYLRPYRMNIRSNARKFNKEEVILEMEIGPKQAAAILRPKEDYCKETICAALQLLGPGASRKQIRKYNIHRYDWLMKHHKEWMELTLPRRKPIPKKLNRGRLDEEMYALASQAIEEVYRNPPSIKITKNILFKALPSYFPSRLAACQKHLQRTLKLINESTETIDQHLYRIFPNVVDWFEKSKYKIFSIRIIQPRFPCYRNGSEQLLKWIEEQAVRLNKHD